MAPAKAKGKAPAAPAGALAVKPVESTTWQNKMKKWNEPVVLNDKAVSEYVESGPVTENQKEENRKALDAARNSDMIKFLLKSEEISRQEIEDEQRANGKPFRSEDESLWTKLPLKPGAFKGDAPLPRKSLASKGEAGNVFLDFMKQFHFGLWGYQQRPYPDTKPFDVQQVLGSKFLEKRYFDFAMRGGNFYYKDRLGRTRGPCEILNLKTAWAAGIIDKDTFVWGDDMDEFAPIGMVYGLEQAVATPDIRLAAAGTGFIHRLTNLGGRKPPSSSSSPSSLEGLQAEALKDKERERTIMTNAGGVWPANKTPDHALFLWAGGSELTSLLDQTTRGMPDKFIPYEARKKLAQEIPGLRPWEVLEVEQAFDLVTFQQDFYRDFLGTFTTPPHYIDQHSALMRQEWGEVVDAIRTAFPPGSF